MTTPARIDGATCLEDRVATDAAELLMEAAQARQLAQCVGGDSVTDLLAYAAELEQAAAKWETRLRRWRQSRRDGMYRTT